MATMPAQSVNGSTSALLRADERVQPARGDVGPVFEAAEVDLVLDLHGDPSTAGLAIYLGGNYFFVLPELVAAFTARHPELAGRVYYETLPPEVVIEQLRRGGRLTVGNLTLTVPPDALHVGASRLEELRREGA